MRISAATGEETCQTTRVLLAVESFCFPLYAEKNPWYFSATKILKNAEVTSDAHFPLGIPFACLFDFVSTLYAHGIFTHDKLQLLFLPSLLYPGLGQKPASYADKTVCGLRPPLFWKSYFNLDCYAGLQHGSTNNKCQQNWAKTALPDKLRNDRLGLRPALQQEPPQCCTTGPMSENCPIHLRKRAWCYKWPNKH